MANDGWYPQALRLPITTKEYSTSRGTALVSVCNHITDGTDSRDWLQHANNGASVHFLIREEGGKGVVYQFMPVHWMAWGNSRHSGLANPYMPSWVKDLIRRGIAIDAATVSIEHERKWPFSTSLPPGMLEASINLHKWLAQNYPIKVDRTHIIGHYQIQHLDRAHCPGGPGGKLFPFDTIIEAMRGTPTPPPTPAPAPAPVPVSGPTPYAVPQGSPTPYKMGGAIADYWRAHGGVGAFGWPLEDEIAYNAPQARVLDDGRPWTTQTMEYQMLAWRPDTGVVRVRLGALYLKDKDKDKAA